VWKSRPSGNGGGGGGGTSHTLVQTSGDEVIQSRVLVIKDASQQQQQTRIGDRIGDGIRGSSESFLPPLPRYPGSSQQQLQESQPQEPEPLPSSRGGSSSSSSLLDSSITFRDITSVNKVLGSGKPTQEPPVDCISSGM